MENKNKKNQTVTAHIPVLLHDVIKILNISPGDCVVDGTLGGGGHAKAILALLGDNGKYLAIDRDQSAIDRVSAEIGGDERIKFALGNFRDIDKHIKSVGFDRVDKILLDIGLSSDQLEARSGRGFSFMVDEPLKMTFKLNPGKEELTAWHVVNEWSEESLADIIFGFGGDRRSRRIAKSICEAREKGSISTSKELAEIIEKAVPKGKGIHPATKTFQAIRMAVNDELGALKEALEKSKNILSSEGRIVVISFHSLEDRIVKHTFIEWEKSGVGERITKKPIVPDKEECKENRRARSAKLRCFQKK